MYRLKQNQEAFEVVDGKFAGRKFRHGEIYKDIPPGEEDRFEAIPAKRTTGDDSHPRSKEKGGKKR